ncbi:unnamed protein product [Protopolystoma xenopodis]|uniref:Uncharacterized protein n=1 Tax=Protopolystoma xenopodis TaxID=117903 RepID=A0A448WTS7_9PLAT|nr:unnamed protein product [Protopolystoma xenopodis]
MKASFRLEINANSSSTPLLAGNGSLPYPPLPITLGRLSFHGYNHRAGLSDVGVSAVAEPASLTVRAVVREGDNVTFFCLMQAAPPTTVDTYPFDQTKENDPRFLRDRKFGRFFLREPIEAGSNKQTYIHIAAFSLNSIHFSLLHNNSQLTLHMQMSM